MFEKRLFYSTFRTSHRKILTRSYKVTRELELNVPEMMPRKGMMTVLTAEVPCDGVRICGRAKL